MSVVNLKAEDFCDLEPEEELAASLARFVLPALAGLIAAGALAWAVLA